MLMVSDTIARRNAAGPDLDQMPRRRRMGPGFATIKEVETAGLVALRAMLIGTLRATYHVVLQRNNGHLDLYR